MRAKPAAKEERVEQLDETTFAVSVREPPREGKANRAIERALAGHFGVPLSQVRLVAGFASKQKIFEVG